MRAVSRVLVVGPPGPEREAERSLFAGAGMLVEEASTAAEALERLGAAPEKPDLVLLARELPDRDALEILPDLKGGEEDFLPVVLVTGPNVSAAERVRGLVQGADDYVARPYDAAELMARARSLLRLKKTHDRVRTVQRELERMVVSDPLTGLYNRRFLLDRLAQEFARVQRYKHPLALAMIDLDGFKPVNDTLGHLVGDRLLRGVSAAIQRSIRVLDVAARYGGDEFALILPQTPPPGALRVCDRVVRAIAEVRIEDAEGNVAQVTASLGVAFYPEDDVRAPEDLVRAADEALYGAKRSGKNRFCAVHAA